MDSPVAPVTFGALLARCRGLVLLTQEQLAERAGIGLRTVQALEAGATRPRQGTLRQLLLALDLPAEPRAALLSAAQAAGPAPPVVEPGPSPTTGRTAVGARPLAALRPVGPGGPRRPAPRRRVRHNLPPPWTSFVGREHAVLEIRRLLSEVRLLTLTGLVGVGKTRLALAVASGLIERYADGVWLVELAPVEDPALVAGAVAAALRLRLSAARPPELALAAALRRGQRLLILDNCEHLTRSCASLAQTLLRDCPWLTILATSREGLGSPGETVWTVPPLAVPAAAASAPAGRVTEAALLRSEAVQLFLDRGRAAQPAFALSGANAPAVAEICRRLDGLPLAIEVMAACLRALSVEQVAASLQALGVEQVAARLDALPPAPAVSGQAPPHGDGPLPAASAWDVLSLSAAERRLLLRLAIPAGGGAPGAGTAVAGSGTRAPGASHPVALAAPTAPGATASLDDLWLLGPLAAKLLLLAEAHDGGARSRLPDPVRDYCRRLLAADGDGTGPASDSPAGHIPRSERELTLLRLIAAGKATKDIAATMGIGRRTTEWRIAQLYRKIGARNRAGATAYAARQRLLWNPGRGARPAPGEVP